MTHDGGYIQVGWLGAETRIPREMVQIRLSNLSPLVCTFRCLAV